METTENLYNVAYTIQLHWVLSRTIINGLELLGNLVEQFFTLSQESPLLLVHC